jgi:hypothetical protein
MTGKFRTTFLINTAVFFDYLKMVSLNSPETQKITHPHIVTYQQNTVFSSSNDGPHPYKSVPNVY